MSGTILLLSFMPSWLGDDNYDYEDNNCRIYPPNRISYIAVDLVITTLVTATPRL